MVGRVRMKVGVVGRVRMGVRVVGRVKMRVVGRRRMG